MNMISTGTFLPEMDASNKQETLAEKFAAVWEKKNSKVARAGGVSLMALSLAACGSSSTTTTASDETASDETASDETTEEETTEEEVVETTPVVNELALTTSSTDETTGTAGADSITGAVSALSAVRTLQVTDTIDGGDGSDSLELQLDAAFTGFTTGSMTGVETLNITNTSTIARNFDASGTTGVEAINLTGEVSVTDLAAIATVSAGARDTTLTIGYAAAAVTGTADVQTLSITDFGTADDADTDADETAAVDISIASTLETTDLTVSGTNVITGASLASKNITATGEGSLEVSAFNAGTKTFDASGVTGDVTLTTTAALASATSIKTGAGDDSVTIGVIGNDITANATISGGDGDDTLVIKGTATTQLTQTGFETMNFDALGGALNMSMTNTSGVENLVVSKNLDHNVTLSSVGAQAMAINVQGAQANSKTVSSDHSGASTITIDTPASTATTTSPSINDTALTLSKTTSVDIDIATKMDYQGTITAAKAESAVVSIDGEANGTLAVDTATAVTIDSVAVASTLTLEADKATELTISGAKLLTAGTHELTSVEYLTLTGAGGADLSGAALSGIVSIDSTSTGDVDFAAIGATSLDNSVTVAAVGAATLSITDTTTNGQNITITATDIVGAVDVDAIDATTGSGEGNVSLTVSTASTLDLAGAIQGDDVTLDLDGVTGAVTYTGDITAKGDVDISMSQLNANDMDGSGAGSIILNGTSQSLAFTGGLLADTVKVATGATSSSVTMTGDLGLGTNNLIIDGAASAVTTAINISGLSNYTTAAITLASDDLIADTVTLGGDKDTVIFAETTVIGTSASNTINSFTAGATKDVLDVDAAAVGGVGSFAQGATTAGTIYTATSGSKVSVQSAELLAAQTTADSNGVIVIGDEAAANWSDVETVITSALTIDGTAASNSQFLILVDNGTDTRGYIFNDTTDGTVFANDFQLLMTVTGTEVTDFAADNFLTT